MDDEVIPDVEMDMAVAGSLTDKSEFQLSSASRVPSARVQKTRFSNDL
jgi:hypothetical protein